MEKVTNPTVRTITTGSDLIAKQMSAKAGDLLPKHLADIESILFVEEGECVFMLNGEDKVLKKGDGVTVPSGVVHQIKAVTDFKGIHFMPKAIKFQFFK